MKQRNLIFTKVLKTLALVAFFSTFTACVVDKEDEMPVEEEVTFSVELLKIRALEIKEGEGDNLEIYGKISSKLVRGNLTEDNTLWTQADTDALPVGLSDHPLSAIVTYTVATANIASSNLIVEADLFDFDGGGTNAPEDLGKEAITTPLSSITSSVTYDIVLNDSSGQFVQVTYSITRI